MRRKITIIRNRKIKKKLNKEKEKKDNVKFIKRDSRENKTEMRQKLYECGVKKEKWKLLNGK
jgi:hypothetical protein